MATASHKIMINVFNLLTSAKTTIMDCSFL